MKEEHSLAKRLKALLDEDRHGRAARKIEEASTSIMGDFHFSYGPESKQLAEVPIATLRAFVDKVELIRMELDEEYDHAFKKLGANNENT
jgi:hypothetical protein